MFANLLFVDVFGKACVYNLSLFANLINKFDKGICSKLVDLWFPRIIMSSSIQLKLEKCKTQ